MPKKSPEDEKKKKKEGQKGSDNKQNQKDKKSPCGPRTPSPHKPRIGPRGPIYTCTPFQAYTEVQATLLAEALGPSKL